MRGGEGERRVEGDKMEHVSRKKQEETEHQAVAYLLDILPTVQPIYCVKEECVWRAGLALLVDLRQGEQETEKGV